MDILLNLVAWFQLTPCEQTSDIRLSNELMSLTSTSKEYRCVLGSIGFSRGIHYWEVTIDKHNSNADIVVGVAQAPVNRLTMLGMIKVCFLVET